MRILGLDVHRPGPAQPYAELQRLFGLLGVDHVVDVGANEGQYGRGLRATGYRGRIDSVEPIPACAARLRREVSGDWFVHECALGAEAGTATLRVYRDSSLSSLHALNRSGLEIWDDPATADELARVEVQVRTLDALLDELPRGRQVWVKCDTQGHDLEVLAGLERHLPGVVGIQTEVAFTALYDGAPPAHEHFARLDGMGFVLAGLSPIGRIGEAAFTEADCLFVRRVSTG